MACCRQPTHLQPNDRLRLIAPRSAGRSSCRIATQAMVNGLKQRFPFVEAIVRGTSTLDLAWTGAGEPTAGEMEARCDLPRVGDLAELGENTGNHRQRLQRFAELVGREILSPVLAYGVDLACLERGNCGEHAACASIDAVVKAGMCRAMEETGHGSHHLKCQLWLLGKAM